MLCFGYTLVWFCGKSCRFQIPTEMGTRPGFCNGDGGYVVENSMVLFWVLNA